MTLKELRENRATVATELKATLDTCIDEGRRPTDDEKKQIEQREADLAGLSDQIAMAERSEAIGTELAAVKPPPPDRKTAPGRPDMDGRDDRWAEPAEAENRKPPHPRIPAEQLQEYRTTAMEAWLNYHGPEAREPEPEQVDACRAIGFNLRRKTLPIRWASTDRFAQAQRAYRDGPISGAEQRALSALVGASGGALVPETLVNQLEVALLAFGGMMQAATVVRTSAGDPMTIPTMDDTANSGRQIGEGAAAASLDPTFGGDVWGAYKYTSDYVDVPFELLQDSSGFDLVGILGQALGTRIGRILNTKFTTGSGAGTPKGATICASAGKTAASQTAIAWAELEDLITAVNSAYRPGSRFMFHDNTRSALAQLTDATSGFPVWLPNYNGSAPDNLKGYPWTVNDDMASSIAASALTILFGRFDRYKIRLIGDIRLYRLTELKRMNDLDSFVAFYRADGNYLSSGATKSLVKYVQAA